MPYSSLYTTFFCLIPRPPKIIQVLFKQTEQNWARSVWTFNRVNVALPANRRSHTSYNPVQRLERIRPSSRRKVRSSTLIPFCLSLECWYPHSLPVFLISKWLQGNIWGPLPWLLFFIFFLSLQFSTLSPAGDIPQQNRKRLFKKNASPRWLTITRVASVKVTLS